MLEVVASGVVIAANGAGVGRLESATVGGIPVPKRVVDELLRLDTRTQDRPQGFRIDSQFELPARIRSVTIDAGHEPSLNSRRATRSHGGFECAIPFFCSPPR